MTSPRPLYTIAAILLAADDLNRLAAGQFTDDPAFFGQIRTLARALADNVLADLADLAGEATETAPVP